MDAGGLTFKKAKKAGAKILEKPADQFYGHRRYGAVDPLWTLLGKPVNKTQSNVPGRSNISFFGYGTALDSATAATKKGVFAAIPVQEGDVIRNADKNAQLYEYECHVYREKETEPSK